MFVTVPALRLFWSYNDELAGHLRRYSTDDLRHLAESTGFTLLESRYFMFFLSPLLYLSRQFPPKLDRTDRAVVRAHFERTHRVPAPPVNALLDAVMVAEGALGRWMSYPWGTSVLAVLQKSP